VKILCTTPIKHLTGIYEHLQEFGKVDYYPESSREELCSLNTDKYDVLFCNPNKQNYLLDEEILRDFKGAILTASTGLNHIDVDYCNKNDIKILSHKDDHGELLKDLPSTAELSFGLMASILRQIPMAFDDVRRGNWSYDSHMGHQLQGKTVGIIGHGRLGSMMAKYCKAFGMCVIIHDPPKGQENLKKLLKLSDIISLHVHANKDTRDMIDKNFLNQIKKHCYIINTSRGEIVNEKDIVDFLESGHLKGYATDVITDEYGNRDKSPILKGVRSGLNILVTPHVGGMTWEGQTKAYKWSIDKLNQLK
jgi:D-3-phosphoglycerate dehydrogenase